MMYILKNILKLCILIFAILLLNKCVYNKNKAESDIDIEGTLKAEKIKIDVPVFNPRKVSVLEGKLIIFDDVEDNMFKSFKLKQNLRFENSWGKRGNGPDEIKFIYPESIFASRNFYSFLDHPTYNFNSLNIDSTFLVVKSYNLNYLDMEILDGFCLLNDTLFSVNNLNEEGNKNSDFLISSFKKQSKLFFGKYPKVERQFDHYINKLEHYYNFKVANPEQQILMVFYLHLNYVQLYDFNGKLLRELDMRIEEQVENSGKKMYFLNPYSSKNFIYVLKTNVTDEKFDNNFESINQELQIFNWNGDLLKRYNLDQPILEFAITDDLKSLYAVDYEGGDYLIKYNLPLIE